MKTEEIRLLTDAAALAQGEGPHRHAVILDLSGVLHIDEPVFHRTLARWLKGDAGPTAGPAGIESYELARNRLALVIDDERLQERRAVLAQVAGLLAEHRRGMLKAAWFELPRDLDGFVQTVRQLAEQASLGDRPEALVVDDRLGRFMAVERSLHAMDLTMLVRQQPVYRFTDESGAPVVEPEPVLLELTVALMELERLFDVPVQRDPWLYSRVTELLDRRMLSYLLHDGDSHRLPVALKLHSATVSDPEFGRLVSRFPAQRHGRVVVELPWLEWEAHREAVVEAITVARSKELGVAIDHVPLAALAGGGFPEADYYRVPWIDDAGHANGLDGAAAIIRTVGVERCILARCSERRAVEEGLAAGFRLLQGPAVTRFVTRHEELEWDRTREQVVGGEIAREAAPEAVPAAEEGGGMRGWLSRLLPRRRSGGAAEAGPAQPPAGGGGKPPG